MVVKQASEKPASNMRGLAVEDATPVVYPRELPGNKKEAFLKMHDFLVKELVDDVADNVRSFQSRPVEIEPGVEVGQRWLPRSGEVICHGWGFVESRGRGKVKPVTLTLAKIG